MSKINDIACSAGCYGAFEWKGMTTNGGCDCLRSVKDLEDKIRIKNLVKAYQDEIRELRDKIAEDIILGEKR